MSTIEPVLLPAWPFLVANHEPGRVDYRTVVAPDFLGEHGCSPILSSLPLDYEDDAIQTCTIHYQSATGEDYRVGALYQLRSISPEGYFLVRPQRSVQIVVGLIFMPEAPYLRVAPQALDESFALYEEDYRQFCRAAQPRDFPVTLSWPLAASLGASLTVLTLPEYDATRIQPRPVAHRPGQTSPEQQAERGYPITQEQIRALLHPAPSQSPETWLTRLRRRITG